MAGHFSANQYEDKYSPRKLGNWEYPKWYPERPKQRVIPTKIIADDNGHLLEGIKKRNPWGNYVSTWELPRRITREYVKKQIAPPERLANIWNSKKKAQSQKKEAKAEAETKPAEECLPSLTQDTSYQRRNKSSSALDLRPRPTKLEPLADLQENSKNLHNIKPGTLDEKIQKIIEEVEGKTKTTSSIPEYCPEIKALPAPSKPFEGFGRQSQTEDEDEKDLNRFEVKEEKPESTDSVKMAEEKKPKETPVKSYSEFRIAKRFHDENLKHKPLPDVIDDPVFKALSSAGHPNPGIALNVQPVPSAIGWKYYRAPGPTECSKLRVYRPKTAVDKAKPDKEARPKTGGPPNVPCKRYLPIDLAICWDLKPEDPSDEPKRTPHIDGSNGSAAPAVFTMIRPSDGLEEERSTSGTPHPVADRIPKGIDEDNAANLPSQIGKARSPTSLPCNKEAIMSCVTKSPETRPKSKTQTPESINSISTNAAEYARKNPKTAWSNEDTSKALSDRLLHLQNNKNGRNEEKKTFASYQSDGRRKYHQSTPNLATVCDGSHCGTEKSSPGSSKHSHQSKNRNCDSSNSEKKCGNERTEKKVQETQKEQKKNRNCSACEKSNSSTEDSREKTEFKAAFKAGVPKSESSNSGSLDAAKSYKVPKMRLPYAKRSYSIGTLVPPFSLWRESNGQVYPEHWRLASVYQHSYKPINSRKRPLLASVYQ